MNNFHAPRTNKIKLPTVLPIYWAEEIEEARTLHQEGHQRAALCKLSELVDNSGGVAAAQPWLVFDLLALKTRVLCAMELEDRASALALATWSGLNTLAYPRH